MNKAHYTCSDCGGTGVEDYVTISLSGTQWAELMRGPGLEDYVTRNGAVENGPCGTCQGEQGLPSITADPE